MNEKKTAGKKADKSAAPGPRRFAVDRLMNVVLAPVVSEKSTFVADRNRQYVFRVADDATAGAALGRAATTIPRAANHPRPLRSLSARSSRRAPARSEAGAARRSSGGHEYR